VTAGVFHAQSQQIRDTEGEPYFHLVTSITAQATTAEVIELCLPVKLAQFS
jgi:hypothetical protein